MPSIVPTFIGSSAWGRRLAPQDLDRVVAAAREVRYKPGELLVRTGDAAQWWYGVDQGLAVHQVLSEQGRPAVLTATCTGTWFGEGTVLKGGCWQYDAVARRETVAVLVPRETFMWLRDTNLAFNQFICQLLNARMSYFMGLLATERLTRSDERMARVLAALFDRDLFPNRPPLLRINQSDMGLMAGMSRQRGNMALQRLREVGLIEITRSGVHVLDVSGLKDYQGCLCAATADADADAA